METLLYGRELLDSELSEDEKNILLQSDSVVKQSGFIEEKGKWVCRRCSSAVFPIVPSYCKCGEDCGYCTNCIQMGKVKRCSAFYSLVEKNKFSDLNHSVLKWKGELSQQQAEASLDIIQTIKKNQTRLLWAVAGAGKTEMLFEGIDYALQNKKRLCIASPRVDVCLELAPRIQSAFPGIALSVLYGEMYDPYQYTQLTIATTHQLYRFKEAFDVLIIDEIDAFPFHMDEALYFAANKSRKKASALIYLSATPDQIMQKKIKQKKIAASILPARYHGYPLPVPKGKWCKDWQIQLLRKPTVTKPINQMNELLKQKKRFLIFLPNIEWMLEWEKVLLNLYPNYTFESVYSSDELRKDKVMKMRNEELNFLLTTTILERGVTFKNIDVLVIGAEDRTFTESALVQISGRAGRSPKYPTGEVTLYHNGWSKDMKKAIKQIKSMNRLAKKRGLLNY